MKTQTLTPTIRENAELAKAGWTKAGPGKYTSPNGNGEFNRRVALALARRANGKLSAV